ncbi:SDR family NAD(P)-dependent oxidoreductase [Chitinophaga sp. Mgbs1]|uniref:SDR family NAD(P)-dependent oxidoreductase n=1 Tax=Chitinophaga solisilvae TaxID=1233460 RepID=A0A3S1CVI7_9BACT|nr:SDR family NAD(P)-dependent oxidoreductase [Chitinophaga solisilvae]
MENQLNALYQQIKDGHISPADAIEKLKDWKARYNKSNGAAHPAADIPQLYKYDEPFLQHHQVNNEQVLLGVTCASLAIDSYFRMFPEAGQVHLHRLFFSKPLVVGKGQQLQLNTYSDLQSSGRTDLTIEYRYDTDASWERAATAQLLKTEREAPLLQLPELKAGMQQVTDFQFIYEADAAVKLGESYRIITSLFKGDHEVLAGVSLKHSMPQHGRKHHLDPLWINSAFLAVTPLLQRKDPAAFLPAGIRDIYFMADRQVEEGWVHVTLVKDNGEIFLFDAVVSDNEGKVIAAFSECAMKKVRPAAATTALQPAEVPLADKVLRYLVKQLGKMISEELLLADTTINLMDLGLTSEQLVAATAEIGAATGLELYPTLFFEYPNLTELTQFCCKTYAAEFSKLPGDEPLKTVNHHALPPDVLPAAKKAAAVTSRDTRKDIAVIGMHGIFPGAASLDEFWEHLRDGKDLIREIPLDHWDYRPWFDENREAKDKTYCKWGSFIDDVDKFDAGFFRISPREADWMDPQLRLLLQSVYNTAEDAGYINNLRGTDTGVFVGVCCHDYKELIGEMQLPVEPYIGTGNTQPMMANRISFLFDLTGPSMAIDTACSSSLFALHSACQALRNNECGMAFVAGVNLLLSSTHYRYFSSIGALSPTGRCHSFDDRADGYVPGEAIATILLKPLAEAERDGDRIYAVIRGSAALHGGYTPSLTAPSIAGEENVILKAWADAGIEPERLGYIEAHGTGTRLGDPIEINSLKNAFRHHTNKTQFCAVGSIKSSIGHTEGTAGIAGMMKVIMQLQHRQIPAMPQFEKLNSFIQLDNTPLFINPQLQHWESPDGMPRQAGVSSFGIAGAYAHVVLEEYIPSPVQASAASGKPAVIVLSAKRADRLEEQARRLAWHIRSKQLTDADVYGIAYTLQLLREPMPERIAFTADTINALLEKLDGIAAGHVPQDVCKGQANAENAIRGKNILQDLIQQQQLHQVPDLWVHGADIDWQQLYNTIKPQAVNLPGYPFAKERYWIPLPEVLPAATAGTSALHPLVQQNTSTLGELRFTSVFNGTEFFIADHVVAGQKILPGVAHFEIAHAAITMALNADAGSHHVRLKDVTWVQPIVAGNEPVKIHIRLFREEQSRVAFEIYSEQAEGAPVIIHSQGLAWIEPLAAVQPLDIEAALQQCSQHQLSPETCYQTLRGIGFFHGSTYQAVQMVYAGEKAALGKLVLPDSVVSGLPQFVLHPVLLDAALTPALGLMLQDDKDGDDASLKLALPFAIDGLDVYSRCTSSMWTYITQGAAAGDKIRKLDVHLYDEQGNLCVRMKGLSFRDVGNSVSDDTTGTLLLEPYWEDRAAIADGVAGFAEHLVVLCEKEGVKTAEITAALPGAACISFADAELPVALRFGKYAQQLLSSIQSLVKDHTENKVLLQVVTGDEEEDLLLSGLCGILMTAQLEHPGFRGQLIATPAAGAELVAQLKACRQDTTYNHTRYSDGKRRVMAWKEVPVPQASVMPWKNGGIYLVTGGAGGLGQLFAAEILQRTEGAVLVLAGRSGLNSDIQATLDALHTGNATISYRRADISNRQEVMTLIQDILDAYGRLDGVLHMAGVNRDNYIIHKTGAELQEVLAPKVAGTVNLDIATKALPLDFFLCFSSGAVISGNAGQADYAAANYFMDAYVAYRKQLVAAGERHGLTLSVNWPLWQAGGMRVHEGTEALMTASTGMKAMRAASGIQAFYRCIASGKTQLMVMEGNVPRMKESIAALSAAGTPPQPQAKSGADGNRTLRIKVLAALQQISAAIIRRREQDMHPEQPLSNYGFDSITFTELANKLNQQFRLRVTPTLFFEQSSLQQLATYLVGEYPDTLRQQLGIEEITATDKRKQEDSTPADSIPVRVKREISKPEEKQPDNMASPIAIIGMSGRFPMAADTAAFWNNLLEGKDCITEIPGNRWSWQEYFGNPQKEGNKTDVKWGAFIDGIDEFDPLFFGISPREAELMDPQQRLLMMYVWKALEDAGYAPQRIAGSQTAIFVGTMGSNYGSLAAAAEMVIEGFSSTGTVGSVGPNRISYFLDLHGPSEPVETACSSSLIALHRAVESIHNGSCEMAIAGGVNTIITPEAHISFSKAGMLSKDGRCKTFSNEANGYVRGEGIGILLLKKLSAAEADGDHIYGVIRATAENHGGRANSLTSPNPAAQTALLKTAYTKAGIDPATVTYIETHGTGTSLGDPIEVNALKNAFKDLYQANGHSAAVAPHCGLGTVKSNIGHLELAAGVAGVIKVLLQLQHKTLVKSLHCETLNPYIELENSPFYIVRETQPWAALKDAAGAELPRRAGISSFGFGGVNAHVVIEEYIPSPHEYQPAATHPAIILLSAVTPQALQEQALQLLDVLQAGKFRESDLPDIAYTLQTGRDAMKERTGFIVSSLDELQQQLEKLLRSGHLETVRSTRDALAVFTEDEELQEAVDKWIQRGKYDKLLDLWIKGFPFDWNRLYENSRPRKISLPTYPFAKESYWIAYQHQDVRPAPAVVQEVVITEVIPAEAPAVMAAPAVNIEPAAAPVEELPQYSESAIREMIVQLLSESLKVPVGKIYADESFADYGLDSITGVRLLTLLSENLGVTLDTTILFDYSSVNRLASYLASTYKPVNTGASAKSAAAAASPKEAAPACAVPAVAQQTAPVSCAAPPVQPAAAPAPVPPVKQEQAPVPQIPVQAQAAPVADKAPYSSVREPIAIIGMSGRFGSANSVEELWEHLSRGTNLVEKVSRWDLSAMADSNESFCNYGSFLDDLAAFDPLFFSISGKEAKYMEPQQRIFLEESWKALEDAGYAGKHVERMLCGVYAGCGAGDYQQLFRNSQEIPAQAFWGNMTSVIPARIAYYLNLQGPAIAVDTACSSSLVAMHLACQGLWEGEISMALAGGIFVQASPWLYESAGKAGMLSPTGCCYTFDDRANGFVPGEGVGVVVLKRLSDAVADGDHIYGIVRGSGINQDGTTNGITAPSAKSQERLECAIYDSFDINPEHIRLIETHGTGTRLGDPIEFNALSRAFRKYTDKQQFCAIGSIKTNIGHTQMAAGVAGVIKALLALQHRQIPPSLHYEKGNANIRFEDSPFFVNTSLIDWETEPGIPRSAAVSSFGASGTNSHVVIAEAPEVFRQHAVQPGYITMLSAHTPAQLRKMAQRISTHTETSPDTDLGNMSFTMLMGRKHFLHRLAVVATDIQELKTALNNWLNEETDARVYWSADDEQTEISEKDGAAAIQYCADNNTDAAGYLKQLSVIASAYVQGHTLSFEQLYAGDAYSRLSLPTYPFSREAYWVPEEATRPPAPPVPVTPAAPVIPVAEVPAPTPVSVPVPSSSAHTDQHELMTFEETWEPQEPAAAAGAVPRIIVCLLEATAQQQIPVAAYAGATLVFIAPGTGYGKNDAHHYQVHPGEKHTYEQVFNDIIRNTGNIDAVLYGWPLTNAAYITDSIPVLLLLQTLSASKMKNARCLLTGLYHNGVERAHLEAWMGIERSLGMIMPQLQMAVVFRSAANAALSEWLQQCGRELQSVKLQSAHYTGAQREVCRIRPVTLENTAALTVKPGGTYLITGGCGGLGLMLARHFTGLHSVNLILTGRKPLDPAKLAGIRTLEQMGSRVKYIQADVSDEAAMQEGLNNALAAFGNLEGVIHAAGISSDKAVLDKTPESFREVLSSKVAGAIILDKLLKDQSPAFVCYFSSSAGIIGDFGSCDYAVANRFLIAYARYRSSLQLPGKTAVISWPLWKSEGMKIGEDDTTQMYLKSSGLRFLEQEEGIAMFRKLVTQSRIQHLVIAGQPARVHRFLGLTTGEQQEKTVSKETIKTAMNDSVKTTIKAQADGLSLAASVEHDLKSLAGDLLQISPDSLYVKDNLADFGFDSISLAQYAQALAQHYNLDITPALFFGYSTLEKLVKFFTTEHTTFMEEFYTKKEQPNTTDIPVDIPVEMPVNTVAEASVPQQQITYSPADSLQEPIAIIGMSGRFPQSRNIAEMWEILSGGKEAVTEIPAERFDWRQYYDGPQAGPGKANCKWGGFIPGVREFDPLFFELSPGDAETMDPRQRLLMQEAWSALEDAGCLTSQLSQGRVGVFVGVEEGDYGMLTREKSAITSNHNAILASRLSYHLNLTGPVLAINTACSSGVVAAHQASMSLRSGECDMAIAAGVHLVLVPEAFVWMGQAGMLSGEGKCYTFDKRANGMVPGEAIVAVVLKRLSAAVADGDPIYAVIKGSGVNYDGKTNGITAPSGVAQTALLKDVYNRYSINPEHISYLVAHGTGTRLGDPVEVNALYDVFRSYTDKQQFCALTSSKTNFGHAMAASGLVSLVGLVQALRHETIPASLHFNTENDYIRWKDSPFYVNTAARHWNTGDSPRTGALSAFGFSGTNAHMVVQSYTPAAVATENLPAYVLTLSAKTEEALRDKIRDMVAYLESPDTAGVSLAAIAYTLQEGRQHFSCRCAVVVSSREEAVHGWKQAGRNEKLPFVFTGKVARDFRMQTALHQYAADLLERSFQQRDNAQRYRDTLLALADLYCQGYELSWQPLYGEQRPQRVHLPAYPFAKETYWVSHDTPAPVVTTTQERRILTETDTLFLEPYRKEQPWNNAVAAPEYEQHLVIVCGLTNITSEAVMSQLRHAQCQIWSGDIVATDRQYQQHAVRLFNAVQSLLSNKPRKKVLVQLLVGTHALQQLQAGLAGILKTAHLENPLFIGQLISISADTDTNGVVTCLQQCAQHPRDNDIRYENGIRTVAAWRETSVPQGDVPLPWKPGGVYLITGGAGGLGWIFAEEIAAKAPDVTLVLCGRSVLSAAKAQQLTALATSGFRIHYKQADVADPQQAVTLVQDIQSSFGRLNGIIHSAGLIRDNFIFKKTIGELEEVFSPKVSGLVQIDEATRHLPLDFLVLFSSGSGIMGNAGQSDYAAANAFMDAYARYRNELAAAGRRSGHTLAISWPLWEEGGMKVDEATRKQIEQKAGMVPLQRHTGIHAFYRCLQTGKEHLMVWEGHLAAMQAFLQHAEAPADNDAAKAPAQKTATANVNVPASLLREKTIGQLKQLLAADIKLDASRIDVTAPLEIYGIDSFIITRLNQQLANIFGDLSKTLFFEYQTLTALGEYLAADYLEECIRWTGLMPSATEHTISEQLHTPPVADVAPVAVAEEKTTAPDITVTPAGNTSWEPVAIIGISGRYPKADNLQEFWKNIASGRDCISEIPADRWPLDGFFHPDAAEAVEQGKSYSKWGGFIDGFADFDPKFFNISPREAINIDPQERLFLQTCWEVLEDAGYTKQLLSSKYKHRVGVFAGITKTGFDLYGPELWKAGKPFNPHTSFSSVANRVSYLFNLHGPSIPIDTMCSSSLVAIHEACGHLHLRDCELAIAGGVNMYLHPTSYIGLCAQHMLSEDGQCKSFGEGGNGFVPGEGTGAVLLKRLSQAIADKDHIYAVIRGTGVNHGGKTNGYTVPSPVLQGSLIRETLDKADVDARTISYIEAHGTGTSLGDPIEITGLTQAFRQHTADKQFCAIGAVKSNIGHLEAAAGIAGITKIILQLKHGKIAPSLHAAVLNPNINFNNTPFKVQQELQDWKRPVVETAAGMQEYPRRAGISSFGAGGVNAHVILEEYIPAVPVAKTIASLPAVILLSATAEARLREMAARLLQFLRQESSGEISLADIAYTLQTGREAMEERLALSVNTWQELEEKLAAYVAGDNNIPGLFRGQIKAGKGVLSDLLTDDVLQQAVEQWIQQQKYSRLMELWVNGFAFDWNRLYQREKPRLISLPAYSFARERYWAPDNLVGATRQEMPAAPVAVPPPPQQQQPQPQRVQVSPERQQVLQQLSAIVPEREVLDKPTGIALHTIIPDTVVPSVPVTAPAPPVPRVPAAAGASGEQLRRKLVASLADALFLSVEEIDEDKNLVDMGLDSIIGVEWVRALNKELGTAISALKVYDYPTIRLFAAFVEGETAKQPPAAAPHNGHPAAPEQPAVIATSSLEQELAASLAEALFMKPEEIETDKNFVDLGLDSVVGVEWTRAINKQFGTTLTATKLYDHPTLESFARYLASLLHADNGGHTAPALSVDDILLQVSNGQLDISHADQLLNHLKN